ncbi:hypothetical protein GEU84_020790 [Fertoebacter nigrum]|uniref:Uncharacterized protein n=1 Tax=Fertoeibacter niger TaxID=2656921 RepID=A0A8X8H3V6_9RHOB|nr:hypothetical protein [Fertoeibacter niger]NUB46825.1 hypothetical protein [Fertoeibacter niger]
MSDTFFQKPAGRAAATPQPSYKPPSRAGKGDRLAPVRIATPQQPEHRKLAPTLDNRGALGLTINVLIDRIPRGCLFKVGSGWFDLDGYWCLKGPGGVVEVRRGSPQKVLRTLTEPQKKELARVRLNARRNKVR